MQPISKRVCLDEQTIFLESIPSLHTDMLLRIFSICPSKVIQMGKMTSRQNQIDLSKGNLDYWKVRLEKGGIYTFEDLKVAVEWIKKDKTLDKVKLKNVEKPLESWRLVACLNHLTSLKLYDDSLNEKIRGFSFKIKETDANMTKTVRLISSCTKLRELKIFPGAVVSLGNKCMAHLSVIHMTNLEKLALDDLNNSSPSYLEFSRLPKLRELKTGSLASEFSLEDLGKCTTLEKLDLCSEDLSFDDLLEEPKLEELKKLSNLKRLALRVLNPRGLDKMFNSFAYFPKLSRLYIYSEGQGVPLGKDVIASNSLGKLENLKEIYLDALMTSSDKDAILTDLFSNILSLDRVQIKDQLYVKPHVGFFRYSQVEGSYPPPQF